MSITGVALSASLLGACAQEETVRRVGILNTAPHLADATAAVRRTLVETSSRRPWSVEFFELEPVTDPKTLPAAAKKLVDSGVDVVVAVTTAAATAAQRAVGERDLPIVFCLVSDPVGVGLVEDPLRPGGRITGVIDSGALLAGKRLEYLVRAQPGVHRVLVVHGTSPPSRAILAAVELAAAKLGVEIVEREAETEDEVERAYRGVRPGEVDAVYVPSDIVVRLAESALEDLAARDGIPTIIGGHTARGALFGYGATPADSGRQAAVLVSKILDGIAPGELPVERARHPKLRLFVGHARKLGYSFSDAAWWLADELVDER